MSIDIVSIVVIIILASLCWYANNQLNGIPVLKNVVNVVIVVFSVLMLLQSLGLTGGHGVVVLR